MSNGLAVRHIRNLEEFEALRNQWNLLLEGHQRKTAFLTWEWLSAWWKHYPENRELWLITVWVGEALVGAAPLMKTCIWKHGLWFRLLQSLGAPNCDESDFLVQNGDSQIAKALCDYLYSQRAQWDAIELNEFESKISLWRLIQDYFVNTGYVIQASPNYHYHIPIQNSWEAYWKKLSKNLRHNIERRLRRSRANHQVEFRHVKGQALGWDDFETLFHVSEKGNFPEKYKSSQERNFHRELLHRMRDHDWIEISFLCLDGQAIAFEYGFNLDGRFEDWRAGFDLDHSELAGGTLLLYYLLKHVHSDGHYDLDFLRGEYDFKEKWLPERREFVELRIVHPRRLFARLALIWLPNFWHWLRDKMNEARNCFSMNSGIQIRQTNGDDSFANLKDQWNHLLSESPNQSAFLSWEWLYSWWQIYGEQKSLYLVTAWRDLELAGIAPFMLEKRDKFGIGLRVLTSLGTPQSDVGGFIYRMDDSEVVASLFDYLSENQSEWDILELNEFLQSSFERSAMKQKLMHDHSSVTDEIKQHYYIPLEGTWESYQRSLPKKFRYNLGRAVRLAEEIGPVECKHYTGEYLDRDVIQTIVQINRFSHYPRLYGLPMEQTFLNTLAQQMGHSHSFGAYLLFVNKQPVAYEYGFHYNGRFEDWRAGFDTRLASNISIGKALAMMVIQACYGQQIREIDFLRGDEPYKLEWKPAAREYVNTRIFNTRGISAFAAYQWLVKVKPRIRQFRFRK